MGTHKFCSTLIGYFPRTLIKSSLVLTTSYAGCPEPQKNNPYFIIFYFLLSQLTSGILKKFHTFPTRVNNLLACHMSGQLSAFGDLLYAVLLFQLP